MNEPILIDQYHIDIASNVKLTRAEVAEISKAFADTGWLKGYIRKQFLPELRDKLLIGITR